MKKGFTLIELLAVIVILAVISTIASPIVLSIIEDAKETTNLRSAEFYSTALEYTITNEVLVNGTIKAGRYPVAKDGNLCKVALNEDGTCPKNKELKIEAKGDMPSGGYVEIQNDAVSDMVIVLGTKKVIINEEGNLEQRKDPCKLISGEPNALGSKYECEVKPGTKYNFYVLSYEEDGTTNLIMDRNICEDGTLATESNKCHVLWQSSGNAGDGPITAMDQLYKATSDWENVSDVLINYEDEGKAYGTITTKDGITQISKIDGSIITVLDNQQGYSNLKARMPYYNELNAYKSNHKYMYLYDNLQIMCSNS